MLLALEEYLFFSGKCIEGVHSFRITVLGSSLCMSDGIKIDIVLSRIIR